MKTILKSSDFDLCNKQEKVKLLWVVSNEIESVMFVVLIQPNCVERPIGVNFHLKMLFKHEKMLKTKLKRLSNSEWWGWAKTPTLLNAIVSGRSVTTWQTKTKKIDAKTDAIKCAKRHPPMLLNKDSLLSFFRSQLTWWLF